MNQEENIIIINNEKDSAMNYRERRHDDWNDNYTLYRDKVITNRLTQRQTVNVPLMKYGMLTILKEINESPLIYFENKDNNKTNEILFNEVFDYYAGKTKMNIKDRMDKKQCILYGRTFKKLNIVDGEFTFEVVDPQDMLVERHVDPAMLDSARTIIQIGIFRTLTDILNNEDYSNRGKDLLKAYVGDMPIQEEESNFSRFVDKQKRMSDMGLIDAYDPVVGETYIELNEVYRKEYDKKLEQNIIQVYVVASTDSGLIELYKKPLHEVIGATEDNYWYDHFPYTSWATDIERTDFWSDSPADIVRQPNKLLNAWISQLSENRTLRNLNMHYYNASNSQFVPQTFQPVAWGWYPVPGNPNELIKDVQVPDLSESLDEMQFVINIAEKAIATSGTTGGTIEDRQVTLGEVQLAVANAKARTRDISLFYNEDWKEFGEKYVKMIEAGKDKLDPIVVYKKGRNGKKLYRKEIEVGKLFTKSGYDVDVKIASERQEQAIETINKLQAVKSIMPNNKPLNDIYEQRLLEFIGLTSEEMRDVIDYQKSLEELSKAEVPTPEELGGTMGMTPQPTTRPQAPVIPQVPTSPEGMM